jgi:isocitrate lyase
MTEEQRKSAAVVDYRPFIIADADTGHGGDAHVRNLIRRFVEVGVPGYHIEDQKPGAKKCGHQAGKVLVSSDEQIKRLSAARLQLDIMRVAGLIVARTDAEAATLLESRADERDQPFMLGATYTALPSYKIAYAAILRKLSEAGADSVRGHLLFAISDAQYQAAFAWLERIGLMRLIADTARVLQGTSASGNEAALDALETKYAEAWQSEAQLKTYGQAIADEMTQRSGEGQKFEMSVDQWLAFAKRAALTDAKERAASMGLQITWDAELPRTPDGYYHVQGGIPYAIAKSLAVCPFADLIWMETKTADLHDAKIFADAIHAEFPDQMLAYNLSPSFNWDTTGMSDEEMKRFPEELGKLGYVFNFITYGGHQIDGLAAEEFATALKDDGMLALARLQRKFRLLESPYKTPQTLVGGPRLDAALMAASGRTAATKAMAKGSTQFQHLVQTEVPPKLLEDWLTEWREHYAYPSKLHVELRPHTAGTDLLAIKVIDDKKRQLADVIFETIKDRRGRQILSVRDQHTLPDLRQKRLMALVQLFLIHRYKVGAVHYLTPTEDNAQQTAKMKTLGIFTSVTTEVGQIIVADVNRDQVATLVKPGSDALHALIRKTPAVAVKA